MTTNTSNTKNIKPFYQLQMADRTRVENKIKEAGYSKFVVNFINEAIQHFQKRCAEDIQQEYGIKIAILPNKKNFSYWEAYEEDSISGAGYYQCPDFYWVWDWDVPTDDEQYHKKLNIVINNVIAQQRDCYNYLKDILRSFFDGEDADTEEESYDKDFYSGAFYTIYHYRNYRNSFCVDAEDNVHFCFE